MAHEVSDAVMTGDHLKALVALRDRLAATIDEASPRDLPPLVLRLTDVLTQLGTLDNRASAFDEVARRRDQRRADAMQQHPSSGNVE